MSQSAQQLSAADTRMVDTGASVEAPPTEAPDRPREDAEAPGPDPPVPNGINHTDGSNSQEHPAGPLESFLTSISKLDEFKFFSEPVREQDAPGYFSVIKQPMDLQTMSEKVLQHQYSTWADFVDDFKLMCNNAMVYNQKRSRVHKTAVTMLRAGIKQLQQMEVEGCKAINCPLPAADGTQPNYQHQQAGQDAMAAAVQTAGPAEQDEKPSVPSAQPPPKAAMKSPPKPPPKKVSKASPPKRRPQKPPSGPNKARPPAVALSEADDWQAELPVDNDACYSSFTDTDDEGVGPPTAASAISAGQWLSWMGIPVVTHQLRPPDTSPTEVASPAFEGELAAAELWKAQRRGAEWRIRWLELRLQELAGREQRYQAQLASLQHRQQLRQHSQSSPAPPTHPSHTPARDPSPPQAKAGPPHPAGDAQHAEGPAEPKAEQAADLASSPVSVEISIGQVKQDSISPQPKRPRLDVPSSPWAPDAAPDAPLGSQDQRGEGPQPSEPVQELAAAPCESQPSNLPHAGGSADNEQQNQQQQQQGGAEADVAMPDAPAQEAARQPQDGPLRQPRPRVAVEAVDPANIWHHPFFAAHAGVKRVKQAVVDVEDSDDADLAPRAFASLDMLEARLEMLQMHMREVPGVARPPPPSGGAGMRGRGRGRGGVHPQKRMRLAGMGPPHLDRQVSKRRREEGDLGDLVSYQSTPRIERLQVKDINTPAVRPLSADEITSRQRVIAAYRARLAAGKGEGTAKHGAKGGKANHGSKGAAGQQGEDAQSGDHSSSEDTSDSVYARLHLQHEADEHIRFTATANAGGAQKKPPSKAELKGSMDAKAKHTLQLAPASSAPPAIITRNSHSQGNLHTSPGSPRAPTSSPNADSKAPADGQQPGSPNRGRGRGTRGGARGPFALASTAAGQAGRPRGRPPGAHVRGRGRGLHSGPGRPGRGSGRGGRAAPSAPNGSPEEVPAANGNTAQDAGGAPTSEDGGKAAAQEAPAQAEGS